MRDDQLEFVADGVRLGRCLVLNRAEFVRAGVVAKSLFADDDRGRLVQRERFGARIGRQPVRPVGVDHRRHHRERGREIGVQLLVLLAADFEVLRIHEDVAAHLHIGEARHLRHDVVRAGAAAAEDFHVETGSLHRVEGRDRRFHPLQAVFDPLLVAFDVLRAAVVGEHPAQFQIRQLVHQLRELQRSLVGRHAASRADGDVDDDVGGDAELFGGIREVLRVLRIVDRLHERLVRFADRHRASNLVRRHVAGRHDDLVDAAGRHGLGLADLRGADANRAGGELQLRDRGAFVRLRVRTAGHAGRRQLPLHRREVLLQLVEIDAERRRVELPLRDADERGGRRFRAHLGGGVTVRMGWNPHGDAARSRGLEKHAS